MDEIMLGLEDSVKYSDLIVNFWQETVQYYL